MMLSTMVKDQVVGRIIVSMLLINPGDVRSSVRVNKPSIDVWVIKGKTVVRIVPNIKQPSRLYIPQDCTACGSLLNIRSNFDFTIVILLATEHLCKDSAESINHETLRRNDMKIVPFPC